LAAGISRDLAPKASGPAFSHRKSGILVDFSMEPEADLTSGAGSRRATIARPASSSAAAY